MQNTVQLPLLPPLPLGEAALPGCWAGHERLLLAQGREVWVNVWFHLFEGGEAVLSLREKDQAASRVHGRWWIEGAELGGPQQMHSAGGDGRQGHPELVMSFGGGNVRSRFQLHDDLLEWAGETLLRLPDRTASMAFGVELPYRRNHRDALTIARS